MQIQFKPGVRLIPENRSPWVWRILTGAALTAPALQYDLLLVTSAADGQHRPGSLHGVGRAFDLRCYGIRPGAIAIVTGLPGLGWEGRQRVDARLWVERLRAWLGPGYDVLLESDHIHAEFQPK